MGYLDGIFKREAPLPLSDEVTPAVIVRDEIPEGEVFAFSFPSGTVWTDLVPIQTGRIKGLATPQTITLDNSAGKPQD